MNLVNAILIWARRKWQKETESQQAQDGSNKSLFPIVGNEGGEALMALSGNFGGQSEADKMAKARLRNLLSNPETAKSGGAQRFRLEDMLPHFPGGAESDTVNTESWCEDSKGNKVYGIYRGRSLLELTIEELRDLVIKLAEELEQKGCDSQERAELDYLKGENGD